MKFVWWYALVAIIAIAIHIFFAAQAGEIAGDKGYDSAQWGWTCFFFGVIGYILVAAMPDLQKRNILIEIRKIEQTIADNSSHASDDAVVTERPVPVVPAVNHSTAWVCKNCGAENAKSALFCKDCGEYK